MMDESDPVQLDAYDVMRYEQLLSEFLNEYSDFDDQISEWKNSKQLGEKVNIKNVPEGKMAIANARDAHPLIYRIQTTREETNNWFLTNRLKLLLPVVDVINAGRAIEVFDELGVLDQESGDSDTSIAEEYVNRLLNEDETLDALLELEVAALFHRNGFDTQLVKEGSVGGRDVVVTEESTEVSIECKRKSIQAPFDEQMEIIGKTISDKVWNQIDIGKDSFVIRISSDKAPKQKHVDDIADKIADVLRNQSRDGSVVVEGVEFHIELLDYYEGERVTSYSGGMPSLSSEVDDLREKVDPFGHLDYEIDPMNTEGHGDVQIFVNKAGQVVIMNAYAMEFDFPKENEVRYNEWVINTIRSASKQLSGHEPGVVFIDLPYVAIEQMMVRSVESYHGGKVSEWERLVDEQIIGLLHKSDSLNAVVFTSRIQNTENGVFEMGRPVEVDSPIHSVINIDPATELPTRFREFIEGSQVEME